MTLMPETECRIVMQVQDRPKPLARGKRMSEKHTIQQPRRLLNLIDQVYEIDDLEQMQAHLFAELRHLVRFSSGVMLSIDPGRFELQAAHCCDCSLEHAKQYLEHYAALDPYLQRDPTSLPINRATLLSELAEAPTLARSEFSEFMARVPYRHVMGTVCGHHAQPLVALAVHRRQGRPDFGGGDRAVFDRLAPHVGRALALREWWDTPQPREKTALLAFSARGELLFMNPAAQRAMTAEQSVLALAALPPAGSGSLRLGEQRYRVCRMPWREVSLLTRLAWRVVHAPAPAASTDAPTGALDWVTAVDTGAHLTIVLLTPFRRRIDLGTRLSRYGLSPREQEITWHSLHCGLGLSELALRFGISPNTVKTHFREVYRKIGVAGQRELLVKVLGLDNEWPSSREATRCC